MSAWAVEVSDYQKSDIAWYGPFRSERAAEDFADRVQARAGRLWNSHRHPDDQEEPRVQLVYLASPNVKGAAAPWE